jgi:hypothetical protein
MHIYACYAILRISPLRYEDSRHPDWGLFGDPVREATEAEVRRLSDIRMCNSIDESRRMS